jgi:hypothetical protein
LDQLSARILNYVDFVTSNTGILQRLVGTSAAKKERVEELALQIGMAVQYGDSVGSPAATRTDREKETVVERQRKASASANSAFSASARGIQMGSAVRGGAEASSESRNTERVLSTSAEHSYPRFDKVKDLLLQLVDLISVERVFLLIDEWPLLDPTGLTRIQPEFANLLKRTFSGSGRVSIKISTTRFQTRLSYRDDSRGLIGLEPDADIFEAVNLDHALLQERELQSFYETMVFKRLCLCSDEFSKLMLSSGYLSQNFDGLRSITSEDVPDGFIELVFRDHAAFIELTKGCEGIPRDFLDLFNRLVKKTLHSSDRWTITQVRDTIRESKINSYQNDLEYNSPSYRLLNISLRAIVLKTGRREFSVSIDDYNVFSSILEILLERRIIHDYPVARIPDQQRELYKIYLIDYGYCLDWLVSYESDLDGIFRSDALTHRDIESIRLAEAVIADNGIIIGRKKCPNCKQYFSPESKSYVKKKLCPVCFEHVGDV